MSNIHDISGMNLADDREIRVGDSVYLGTYMQNKKRPSKVEWIIIHIEGEKALLVSKYALITSGYCCMPMQSDKQLEWEGSLAREKCREFYHECFSPSEQVVICEKETVSIHAGSSCVDHVFLLTEEETNCYFPDPEQRKCAPTRKALEDGARLGWTEDTQEYTSWWLMPECVLSHGIISFDDPRETDYVSIYPKAVFQTGDIQYHSRNVYHSDFCIRPSILVNTDKFVLLYGDADTKAAFVLSL